MKPICVLCQRFYRVKKNGVWFIEGMPRYNGAPSGTAEPDSWRPYKLWHGDLWECQGCGHETISGVGRNPVSIQHEPDFAEWLKRTLPLIQVNDC